MVQITGSGIFFPELFYAHGCGEEGSSKSCPHPSRRVGEEEAFLLDFQKELQP